MFDFFRNNPAIFIILLFILLFWLSLFLLLLKGMANIILINEIVLVLIPFKLVLAVKMCLVKSK